MFGKGLIKIIGYAITGAIALVLGAQLLSSVVSIVLAFRVGNSVPFLSVVLITGLVLLGVSRMTEGTFLHMVLNILGYATTGYLVVVVFVLGIPFGLVVSFLVSGITVAFCSALRDPGQIQDYLRANFSHVQLSGLMEGISKRVIPVGDGSSFVLNSAHNILILKEGSRAKVIQLMRERPRLSISITHYVDCDALFISKEYSSEQLDRILKLLKEYDINIEKHVSSLLAEAIQMIPIIDSSNGLRMDDYRMTTDEATIEHLLTLAPPRLTIFPSDDGLGALIPEMEAPGLNVEQIRHGYENELLLQRNFASLREVERKIENTT